MEDEAIKVKQKAFNARTKAAHRTIGTPDYRHIGYEWPIYRSGMSVAVKWEKRRD